MTNPFASRSDVAIACGGTGGHLFPGLAVAEQMIQRGCGVTLLISSKAVDQEAVRGITGMTIQTLPAVGLTRGSLFSFLGGFLKSYRVSMAAFKARPPRIALAMGGFTSAPPVLAARRLGALTFLHESNTIPGRANRWLSWTVEEAFVGFACAAKRLHTSRVAVTGTPVRRQFRNLDRKSCKVALGFDTHKPLVLVTGGSQGASGINDLILKSLPALRKAGPLWQWLHLPGTRDAAAVDSAYAASGAKAVVRPFMDEMDLALGAADAAISRAGASSLAELAAVRLPAVLIPFPAAVDNHQLYNARELAQTGAALVLEQKDATPELLVSSLKALLDSEPQRQKMAAALAAWDHPAADSEIAEAMLKRMARETVAGVPPERCSCINRKDAQTGKVVREVATG